MKMAGCKRKDFNELVPDMVDAINCGQDELARAYLRHIADHMFRDLDKLTNVQAAGRIAHRARVFKNVVYKTV